MRRHRPAGADGGPVAVAARPMSAHAAFVEVRSRNDVAAVLIGSRGTILEATDAAAAMLGYGQRDLVGRSLHQLGADGWHWSVDDALLRLSSDSPDPFNLQLVGRSGRRALIEMIPRPNVREHGVESQHLLVWREHRVPRRQGPISASESELQRLAFALIDTQEHERSRTATQLHDGVAPLVIAAKFFAEGAISSCNAGDHRQAAQMLDTAVERLRDVLSEIQRITIGLRPSSLNDLGLLPTITWFCRDFSQLQPGVKLECHLRAPEERIPGELKLQIFRILEEAMRNVGDHAGATSAVVELVATADEIVLRIEDNGAGFDTERILSGDLRRIGVGLHSIAERVDATGGRLEIRSADGTGTALVARWPLHPPAR